MRWLRRILLLVVGSLGLVLAAYAALLLEAHLEMRRVAPALPERAELERLAGGGGPQRIHYVGSGTQRRPDGRRSTYGGFLLEWDDGRAFLVDVGMDREGTRAFGRLMERAFGADPVQVHGSPGEQLGAEARRIEGVGFTHLHQDHTGGMAELCAAIGREVAVFQTPDQADRGNFGTRPGRAALLESDCPRFERLAGGPLRAVPGFPGLFAVAVGGHTPGSTVWFAEVDGTVFVLAGDVTNSRDDLLSDTPKPLVYSLLLVPEARARLGELRRFFAALDAEPPYRVVVSHDLGAIEASGIPGWQ